MTMASILVAAVIGVLAVISFLYLAWDLVSVWQARGWSGKEEDGTAHGPSDAHTTAFKTYGSEDCHKYCVEHPYLTNVTSPLGCDEICR